MSAPNRREDVHFQGLECDICRKEFAKSELDQDSWCKECRPGMRRRMAIWTHGIAALIVLPFGIWILTLDSLEFLPKPAWLLPLGAAYYLGFRIGRELVKGYVRWRQAQ